MIKYSPRFQPWETYGDHAGVPAVKPYEREKWNRCIVPPRLKSYEKGERDICIVSPRLKPRAMFVEKFNKSQHINFF